MDIKTIRFNNARQVIDAKCGGMVTVFADKLGKVSSQISSIAGENAKKPIGNKIAREIEQTFGLSYGWMDEDHNKSDKNVHNISVGGLVPLISKVSAGKWCESNEDFNIGDIEDWLPLPPKGGKRTFALSVDGDSMTAQHPNQRSYPHGTIIYVDPDKQVTNGARVVAKIPDGEYTFKVYSEDAGRKYLKPINTIYPMIDVTGDVKICGVVIGSYLPE